MAMVNDSDLGEMIVGNVRYALGRKTHIVETTANWVVQYRNVLSDIQIKTIIRDINREIRIYEERLDSPLPHRKTWDGLLVTLGSKYK